MVLGFHSINLSGECSVAGGVYSIFIKLGTSFFLNNSTNVHRRPMKPFAIANFAISLFQLLKCVIRCMSNLGIGSQFHNVFFNLNYLG